MTSLPSQENSSPQSQPSSESEEVDEQFQDEEDFEGIGMSNACVWRVSVRRAPSDPGCSSVPAGDAVYFDRPDPQGYVSVITTFHLPTQT